MFLALAAVSGLILGKLADLLLPLSYRETDVSGPLVRCNECRRPATAIDAIPLIELFALGRCRECRAAAPIRWFVLPVGTAVLGALCYLEFDEIGPALVGTFFSAILLSLVFTDIDRGVLPDRIVLPSIVAAAALGWGLPGGSLLSSGYGLIAAVVVAVVLVLGSLPFGRSAFGMGDVKLIVMLGVLIGARDVVIGVLLGFIASSVIAAGLLATRQMSRGSHMPMGPFLALGGFTAMVWGDEIWDWWVE